MSIYDLIVIGAGPGGYVAAERAGALGKRVLLIEKAEMGGVCTNWGCIPTKSLLNSAKHLVHAQESSKYGVHCGDVTFELSEAMAWKDEVVQTLRSGITFLMKKHNVEVVAGEAVCIDRNHVAVGETVYACTNLIIATGSSPFVPPIPGVEHELVMTSKQILSIDRIPRKLAVIGGGVIGMEFGSLFSSIGSEVTVIEMMPEILPMMDGEFAKLMRREMKKITCKTSCRVEEILPDGLVYTDKKGKRQQLEADAVLLSVGRRPNTGGLKELGLDIDRTGVVVDQYMRTNLPGVYAIGDVNGKSMLAHTAYREAEVVVRTISGERDEIRYDNIPSVIYTTPEVAVVGLTEKEATKEGYDAKSVQLPVTYSGRHIAESNEKNGRF